MSSQSGVTSSNSQSIQSLVLGKDTHLAHDIQQMNHNDLILDLHGIAYTEICKSHLMYC